MKKCYFKLLGYMATAATLLVAATSCSDDEKEYTDDIYFTGSQQAVKVIGATASSLPGAAVAAFKVTFDAASNWQISAKELSNPGQTAEWISFYTSAGEEGSQILGVYVTANTSALERAATIEIASNGKTASFTLVQQSSAIIANPNAASIDAAKKIKKIEYYANGTSTPAKTIEFGYNANGVLASETITDFNGENKTSHGYVITVDGKTGADAVGLNKVTVTPDNKIATGETFAIVNGQVAIGYNTLLVKNNTDQQKINFGFDNGLLKSIAGQGLDYTFAWGSGNLTAINSSGAGNVNATYGTEANDCNLDLNWFVGLQNASFGVTEGSNALEAMNLMGKRSANLVTSADGENFTYTPGVATDNGTAEGLTVTTSKNRTIKVYFAE